MENGDLARRQKVPEVRIFQVWETIRKKVVFQLPNVGSWFENLAITSTGTLLATRVDVPEIWSIDPTTGEGKKLISFPSPTTSVTGIDELRPNFFAIGAGQYDLTKGTIPGTWGVWTYDLSEPSKAPVKVTDVPPIGLLNGLATWDETHVFVVDSTFGKIFSVDVIQGTFDTVSDDELLAPGEGAFIPLGVNGIKVHPSDRHVYITNSARMFFGRLLVSADGKAAGPVEVLARGFLTDDFAFGPNGEDVYITTHGSNTIVKVHIKDGGLNQAAVEVAGDKGTLELAGGTACAFGKGKDDTQVLYVVCAGALSMPVDGKVEPAKVVAVNLL
ncbi:hypothetical protein B7463_g2232, partial [Scytalidium lignicola]